MKAYQAFEFNIERAESLATLYEKLRKNKRDLDIDDLLRASYVLTVGALDAYVHDRVSERLVYFIKSKLNSKGNELKPITEALSEVETVELLRWLTKPRPFVQVRKVIEERIGTQSFQHPGKIEEAFGLIGKRHIWQSIADKMKVKPENLRRDVANAATRRNQIVHDGDREKSRLKKHKKRTINHKDVTELIQLTKNIGHYLDNL